MSQGYSAILMDHFESPRNAGRMREADAVGEADVGGRAPRITLYVKLCGERVARASFQSFGCGATIAAGSLLTELIAGKTVGECRGLTDRDVDRALGGLPPNKRFCSALAILALNKALDELANPKTAI